MWMKSTVGWVNLAKFREIRPAQPYRQNDEGKYPFWAIAPGKGDNVVIYSTLEEIERIIKIRDS